MKREVIKTKKALIGIVFSLMLMAVLASSVSAKGGKLKGDFNHDCIVDDKDLDIFITIYGSTHGDGIYRGWADFNKDGKIDRIDFAIFANEYYGKTC